jgi:hypothetical protein
MKDLSMKHSTLDEIGASLGLEFNLRKIPYNVDYKPDKLTRITTNYANLARGHSRKDNIKFTFELINTTLNKILTPQSFTNLNYKIDLFINQVIVRFHPNDEWFPLVEMLGANVIDNSNLRSYPCCCGFNLSSYLRDFDFNVILPKIKSALASQEEIENFGVLHGKLFQLQFKDFYRYGVLDLPVFIAISVANGKVYQRIDNVHDILGVEYIEQGEASFTSKYFAKMGMHVRYFMPKQCQAPLAIYHYPGTLVHADQYSLAALIATMDTFQRICRPEIYNTIERAGEIFNPSLTNQEYTKLALWYDRIEGKTLALNQALLAEQEFIAKNIKHLTKLL